jgi:hypothetical protein
MEPTGSTAGSAAAVNPTTGAVPAFVTDPGRVSHPRGDR